MNFGITLIQLSSDDDDNIAIVIVKTSARTDFDEDF